MKETSYTMQTQRDLRIFLAFYNHFETIYVAIWKFSINNAKNERLIESNFTHEEI